MTMRLLAIALVALCLCAVRAPTPLAHADNGITTLNMAAYRDSIGVEHLVGEARNDTGQAVKYVELVASMTDAAGNFLATGDGFTSLDILQPGDVSPYDILVSDAPAAATKYTLQVQSRPASDPPVGGLTILNDKASRDSIGFAHVIGQVRNDGTSAAKYVEILGTFYNADGTVAWVDQTFSKLDTIAPGQTSPFEIFGSDRVYARYRLQVQGQLSH